MIHIGWFNERYFVTYVCLSYRGLGWLKSRKCLSVKMKELMGSICCSCSESVKCGCPQCLRNSDHIIRLWEKSLFYGPLQKHLHTLLLHPLAAYILHSCCGRLHVPCSCHSSCLEERKPLGKKGAQMYINLPTAQYVSWRPSPKSPLKLSRVWLYTMGVWGMWMEDITHDSSPLIIPLIAFLQPSKAISRFLELVALFRPVPFLSSLSSAASLSF